jgi:hypothetical protein
MPQFLRVDEAGADAPRHVELVERYRTRQLGGTLDIQSAIGGSGSLIVQNASQLTLNAAVADQVIGFGAGGGNVTLTDEGAFGGGLSTFGAGDSIDLADFQYSSTLESLSVQNNTLTVTDTVNGLQQVQIALFGQFAAGFRLASDGGSGTLILPGMSASDFHPLAPPRR